MTGFDLMYRRKRLCDPPKNRPFMDLPKGFVWYAICAASIFIWGFIIGVLS